MLTIQSLTIQLSSRRILSGIDLTVRPGRILALIGPNGSGKSTLIRAASGELTPALGRVTVNGQNLKHLPIETRARQIAVVPQAIRLPELFTACETVLMGRTAYLGWLGRESKADQAIAIEAMRRTNTLHLAARRIGELSGGEQQRVLIARALTQSAPILLMDEPTSHLDLKYQNGILTLVRDLAHVEGLAVLIVLHDLNLAAQYADEVALLANGQLRAVGSPAEVLTSELLSAAYDLPIHIAAHPINGHPFVAASA